MRKIIFRGKTKAGKWIFGDLVHIEDQAYIFDHGSNVDSYDRYKVNPKTIGQFTGLRDKNGGEAFCGDIFEDNKGVYRTIFYADGGFVCESNPISFSYGSQGNSNPTEALADQQVASWFYGNCQIIGNIYDNLKLINL
jgi:uncharacterized phage protein (TIGR01671 family)